MGVVRSKPFILLSGDVISNMDLKKVIQFHKDKLREDSNAIMTVVMKRVQAGSGVKALTDDLVVAMQQTSSQLLLFEDRAHKRSVGLPIELLAEHSSVTFRTDLLDCHIDICSPELMLQFFFRMIRHFSFLGKFPSLVHATCFNPGAGVP